MSFYISRTPHRISLFGGGTDHKPFFEKHQSFVINMAINQYSYITARKLPAFHDYKTKVVYSEVEHVKENDEIKHRIINKVLETLQIYQGLEIIHSSDIPSGGTGSSAAFTVGLLNVLQALDRRFTSPKGLAESAVLLEREILKEATGYQDAYACSFGGFNLIKFYQDNVNLGPIIVSNEFVRELENSCLLVYVGKRQNERLANTCFNEISYQTEEKLKNVLEIAEKGLIAIRKQDLLTVAKLIDESWQIKKQLSPSVSNQKIDEIYSKIKFAGGFGKLIGAGGGGFILAVFPQEIRAKIVSALSGLTVVPFKISYSGSEIIYAQQ